jgi:hypothetical protein
MNISWFNTPINSPVLIILTVIFVLTSAITSFDKRAFQTKRARNLSPDEAQLPAWTRLILFFHWGFALALFVLNWKWTLFILALRFIVSFFPVLEIIGNWLMAPFRPRK